MKNYPSTMEDSLKQELWKWLHRTLDHVDALHACVSTPGESDGAVAAAAIESARKAIEAVRLYASECVVVAQTHGVSTATLHIADLVTQLCQRLEEEVTALDEELVTRTS